MLHTKLLFQCGFNPFTANPTCSCNIVSDISKHYYITIASLLFMPTQIHAYCMSYKCLKTCVGVEACELKGSIQTSKLMNLLS